MPVYWYLSGQKLLQPREDIRPDWVVLSESGKRVLAQHRMDLEKMQQHACQDAKEKAEKKKEKRSDRLFEFFLALSGYILGLFTDHFFEVIEVVLDAGSWIVSWFLGLFS